MVSAPVGGDVMVGSFQFPPSQTKVSGNEDKGGFGEIFTGKVENLKVSKESFMADSSSNQSMKTDPEEIGNPSNKVKDTKDVERQDGQDQKSTSLKDDKVKTEDSEKSVSVNDETEEEVLTEEIAEVLNQAVVAVIESISQTFDVSVQDVTEAIEEIGVSDLEILDPDVMSKVSLSVAGETDMTKIITDEELYADFKEVNKEFSKIIEDVSKELGVESTELTDVIQKAVQSMQETPAKEPVTEFKAEADVKKVGELQTEKDASDVKETDPGFNTESAKILKTGNNVSTKNENTDSENNSSQPKETVIRTDKEPVAKNDTFFENPFRITRETVNESLPTEETVSLPEYDRFTTDVMKQIVDNMRTTVKEGMSTLEMQLHPESLGSLQVQLSSKGGAVTAQFVAQDENVKNVLESQLITLKETFAEKGVTIDAIEVSVEPKTYEQAYEGQQQNNESGKEPSKRNRRALKIDGDLSDMNIEEMNEADKIAVQMMAANGNTVDYTA
ncbi:MAG: flagellar hook-length control protein FliK [Acetatifactor sp.]|nr:flagellar hook-length control protein FliK [Acetatifactor sp.]